MSNETDVTTLDVSAIRDFQVCELYYRFRHEEERHIPIHSRSIMADKFENTLKKVASFFFYKKQADIVPSYTAILNRWEKLWFPRDMTAYDMAVEQHDAVHANMATFSNTAAASLEAFHDEFAKDISDALMIDEHYLIPLHFGTRLSGSIDLVLRKNNHFRVIKWFGRNRRPGTDTLNLDMAAMKFAFEHRNDKKIPGTVEYLCYDLTSARGDYLDIEQPTRADVDALLYWASEIKDREIYVPRRGFTSYCKGCPFDEPCAEFDGWPKVHVKGVDLE